MLRVQWSALLEEKQDTALLHLIRSHTLWMPVMSVHKPEYGAVGERETYSRQVLSQTHILGLPCANQMYACWC